MSPLRAALFLILASGATSALADQITCESQQENRQRCPTNGGDVRLVNQLSRTQCIEGRTWGADREGIWVSGGCRAVFEVQEREDSRGEQSREWQHGFRDGQRGTFDQREQSHDYGLGYRSGQEAAARNGGQYRDEAPPADDHRDERRDDRRDESRDEGTHLPGRARRACIDQATQDQSFGPDRVSIGDVRRVDEGVFKVELRTPAGRMACVVDREGNVQSMDSRR
jgi:hypothetical protein